MPVTLDPVTHKNLLALRGRENAVEKELKKAEALGLDVTEHRAQFEEAKRIRKVLLENYAPSGVSLETE
jgi:hypothetical protein